MKWQSTTVASISGRPVTSTFSGFGAWGVVTVRSYAAEMRMRCEDEHDDGDDDDDDGGGEVRSGGCQGDASVTSP